MNPPIPSSFVLSIPTAVLLQGWLWYTSQTHRRIHRQIDIHTYGDTNIHTYTYPAFAGPSGIRAGWGIETNGRFEAERPSALAGPPSGGRAAFMTPMHPLYCTRPHDLVQAIFGHTCPNLDLGP